jgi:hypothetical protein
MNSADIAETLKLVLRREFAACEKALRARETARAQNELAAAMTTLRSVIRALEAEAGTAAAAATRARR